MAVRRGVTVTFAIGVLVAGVVVWRGWLAPVGPWTTYAPLESLPHWAPDGKARFVVLGDTQPQWRDGGVAWHPKARVMRDRVRELAPELVVHVGDLVDASDAQLTDASVIPDLWRGFLDFYAPVLEIAPLLPVRGNHDIGRDGWVNTFELPEGAGTERFWKLDIGPIRFIALDTNLPAELVLGGRQSIWFERVMREPGPRDTFVLMHHPPVSVGPTDAATYRMVRRLVTSHASRVTAVFCGHDHLYHQAERDGVRWFVTGGGGWYLSDVRAHKATAAPASDVFMSVHHVLLVETDPTSVSISCVDEHGAVIGRSRWAR